MNELTLEWVEDGEIKTRTITSQQPTKNLGAIRVGRDPVRADIVIQHPTVSGLHVEVFFDSQRYGFFLRNLRDTNPPVINRQKLIEGEINLQQGMSFYLGQVEIKVVAIAISSLPKTVVFPPTQPINQATVHTAGHSDNPPNLTYGLMCPKCRQISPYNTLRSGCSWCGSSLASAASVLLNPGKK